MNDKNFINFHVLISHSPSCLNRDDMNMQKSALFGGKRRVRISSQSLKRAMRKPSEYSPQYWLEHFGSPSTRTRSLQELKHEFIEALCGEFPPEIISETIERFAKSSKPESEEESDDVDTDDDNSVLSEPAETPPKGKKLAVAPWVLNEIRELCRIIQDVRRIGLSDEEEKSAISKFEKQKGKKKKPREDFIESAFDKKIKAAVKENMEVINRAYASAMDIALFGRMATSGLMTSIDGSLAVAHTITTHAVDADIDWFTAVDDLVAEAGEMGAGHLDTQEFSAGVFYRYASLNLGQLQVNLGGVSRERALDIARHVLHMLATVVPSAKQQSFAAHNLADFALVSFSDLPVSLANAFEQPVAADRTGGYLKSSVEALVDYWDKVHKGYGLDERVKAFALSGGAAVPDLSFAASLPALEAWIAGNGEG